VTGLAGALQFLTRVPVRTRRPPDLTASVPWFPVVGALVGAFVGAIAAALHDPVGPLVAAAVAVLAGVLLTGAFHEDGLADVADAFAGGWSREDRFRILKDPLHGSYGVAALCGSIVLRVVALGAITTPAAAFAVAVAAHATGRAGAVGVMAVVPTARPDGLGADYVRALRRGPAAVGVLAGLGLTALAVGWWVAAMAAAAVVAAAATAWLAVRKLGGVTGDVLGAVEQVAECTTFVVGVALVARHPLWWR
jgi:adenosylcobinamide-GDP ribazoletransferase